MTAFQLLNRAYYKMPTLLITVTGTTSISPANLKFFSQTLYSPLPLVPPPTTLAPAQYGVLTPLLTLIFFSRENRKKQSILSYL